ncbi:MAG: DUF4384 domain-containing protein [Bacteroidales bacterium]|nr:DUF4384 domain-containing protein [Bacteroidales bacterium]
MMRRIFSLIVLLGVCSLAVAQKVVDVCGEYTYYPSEDVTLAQAKQTALQRARIEGLIKEFNETVYQSNTSVVSNRNGESNIDLYSFGGTDARGEWIEDTKQPEYKVFYEQDQLVVIAKICGKAREIKSAGVEVESRVLRNGITPKFESGEFNAGDDMYLYFRAPVDGYITVYLLDRGNQMVYCLLPYRNSPQGAVQVSHDQVYVFFKQDKKLKDWQYIDEYTLTAENAVEWNEVYVVFSQHPFSKALTNSSNELTPRELTFKDFSAWISRCQSKDPDMMVKKHLIKILNSN